MRYQEVAGVWEKKLIGYSILVINFWTSEIKKYEETLADKQSQNGRLGYHIDKITFVKGGGTLNA